MSGNPHRLRPDVGERGLGSADPEVVADLLAAAWTSAGDLARSVPLDVPARTSSVTTREVLVPLGSWPEHERFTSLVSDVRHDRVHDVDDAGARAAMINAAHHDEDGDAVGAALERAGDAAVAFLRSPDAAVTGREPTESALGPMPLTTLLVAATYDLAIAALDVAPPDAVPAPLLDAAVAGLVDVTAALAARQGLDVRFRVRTPEVSWAACTTDGDWTTVRLDVGPDAEGWPTVEGAAHDVLDASAGRRQPVPMLVSRRLRLRDVPALLAVLPALDAVQTLPGGTALQAAARTVARTGQAFSRLGGLTGR